MLPSFPLTTGPGRDVNVLLLIVSLVLPIRPVATAAIAAIEQVAKSETRFPPRQIAVEIARQITAKVTIAALRAVWSLTRGRVTAIRHAAKIHAPAQNPKARPDAIPAHGAIPQAGTTGAARMGTVGAAKTFVGREVTLVRSNCHENERTHEVMTP